MLKLLPRILEINLPSPTIITKSDPRAFYRVIVDGIYLGYNATTTASSDPFT